MNKSSEELVAAACEWLAQDPDEETRAELAALLEPAPDVAALNSRFSTRLEFGTAGLRGELGAGPNRMNRVVVAQTAAGLARFLLGRPGAAAGQKPSVVIGYDARFSSDVFARDSAEIFAGFGLRALLFPHIVPTPLVAFAIRHLNLDAAVQVTASHNPPRDNGYKVYLGGEDEGSQIVSPTDGQIAAEILKVASEMTFEAIPKSSEYELVSEDVIQAYIDHTASLVPKPEHPLKTVYTAMHGVGLSPFLAVFEKAGFPAPIPVDQQAQPDPRFPTVAFPNPEEPGAMDLSFAKAAEVGAELIIANDPDADRLAIAIPSATGWTRLTGDQVGMLLGDFIASSGRKGTLACSIVSSTALSHLAKAHGREFQSTPTGFKFISRVPDLAFGYEEALGYCVDSDTVRDKDGISAALLFAFLASKLKGQGKTIASRLEELGNQFGHFATSGVSVRVKDVAQIPKMMAALRVDPPRVIAGLPAKFTDLRKDPSVGIEGLRFILDGGARVIVRPSGTEPKLKCYLEAVGSSAEEATERLEELEAGVRGLLMELERNAA